MSSYFDGFFACDLKADVPQQVIETLQYMTRTEEYTFTNVPDDKFFKDADWKDFLRPPQDYRVAPGWIGSELNKMTRYISGTETEDYYTISFRRSMHDDHEWGVLWWDFLFWIVQHSDMNGYVGYYREKYAQHPTLIYFQDGNVHWLRISETPERLDPWSE